MAREWLDMPPLDNYEVLVACCNRYKRQLQQLHTLYLNCNDLALVAEVGERCQRLRWRWFYCYGALRMAAHLTNLSVKEAGLEHP